MTNAGRELDTMIAERVMGWRWASFSLHSAFLLSPADYEYQVTLRPWMGWAEGANEGASRDIDGGRYTLPSAHLDPVPKFSTDIAAAWCVVDHLVANGFSPDVIHRGRGVWSCVVDRFTDPDSKVDPWPVQRDADSPTLAICLAALASIVARHATEPAHA